MHIIPATDLEGVRQMLETAGLPYRDVGDNPDARFFLLRDRQRNIAVVGLEPHGHEALLRSLVVTAGYRGNGLGTQLVSHVGAEAARLGATALYLLTIDAADYFRHLGFRDLPRSQAPDSIRGTREFGQLCPDHALLLWLPLDATASTLPKSTIL